MGDLLPIKPAMKDLVDYKPEEGLKKIAVAEAAEKTLKRQLRNDPNDPFARQKLRMVISAKIREQANYAVWRQGAVEHGHGPGRGHREAKKEIAEQKSLLPAFDPGDVAIHRWRKSFCRKVDRKWENDEIKEEQAIDTSWRRSTRICEQEPDGTVRGTEGTGEFERYTPAEYIDAARAVLGEIDLDPASCVEAQKTVRASIYFTAEDDGLQEEWNGRVWLNPPYHRDLAPKFIRKLIEEVANGRTTAAIMLTNNCTDTDWFRVALVMCKSVCFTAGRIRFTVPNGGDPVLPTQGQAFFYYGNDLKKFERVFSTFGSCMRPSQKYRPALMEVEG